jgi:hypothetical protein
MGLFDFPIRRGYTPILRSNQLTHLHIAPSVDPNCVCLAVHGSHLLLVAKVLLVRFHWVAPCARVRWQVTGEDGHW